ncbi:hypothetical protein CC79DRAFT_823043 [Sarocladium strictum]
MGILRQQWNLSRIHLDAESADSGTLGWTPTQSLTASRVLRIEPKENWRSSTGSRRFATEHPIRQRRSLIVASSRSNRQPGDTKRCRQRQGQHSLHSFPHCQSTGVTGPVHPSRVDRHEIRTNEDVKSIEPSQEDSRLVRRHRIRGALLLQRLRRLHSAMSQSAAQRLVLNATRRATAQCQQSTQLALRTTRAARCGFSTATIASPTPVQSRCASTRMTGTSKRQQASRGAPKR